jgi:hypothetical protein
MKSRDPERDTGKDENGRLEESAILALRATSVARTYLENPGSKGFPSGVESMR